VTVAGVVDGAHTYTARSRDAAGNTSPVSTRNVSVDTGPPDTTILTGPPARTNDRTPTFTFRSEPGATFTCRVDGGPFTSCTSPHTTGALGQGEHTFAVRADDVAGNRDETPATRTFFVDLTPPVAPAVVSGPEGATTESSPAFDFTTEAGTTVECRLDGPGGPGSFAPCSSPRRFEGLAPGAYTLHVRSTDTAGNPSTTSRSFTVTVPQPAQTPVPTPQPTPTPSPAPTPVVQQTVVAAPTAGRVLVRRRGSTRFEALDAAAGIPLGSEVDAKAGRVRITSVPRAGASPESADFYAGIFVITQRGGITDLRLSERLTGCRSARATAAQKRKVKSRRLWGDGRGRFRISGRYSAATVRGTRWMVQDTCTATTTRVTQGVVSVRDKVKRKTVLVKKGKRYTARRR
jgi:hypothetical protein